MAMLFKEIELTDLSAKIKDTLILGDVHIGFEEAANKSGMLLPRIHFNHIYQKMEELLQKERPKKIIINGDLKHEFGKISRQEWRETLKVIDLLEKNTDEIILIKGNHDKIIEPIIKHNKNIKIAEYHVEKNTFICHGDKLIENEDFEKCKNILIGHEHPAIKIRDGLRTETFKCFLKGKFKGKNLLVLPSFNPLTEGTDILQQQTLSPFLKGKLLDFQAYIINEGKIFNFGRLKDLPGD